MSKEPKPWDGRPSDIDLIRKTDELNKSIREMRWVQPPEDGVERVTEPESEPQWPSLAMFHTWKGALGWVVITGIVAFILYALLWGGGDPECLEYMGCF